MTNMKIIIKTSILLLTLTLFSCRKEYECCKQQYGFDSYRMSGTTTEWCETEKLFKSQVEDFENRHGFRCIRK